VPDLGERVAALEDMDPALPAYLRTETTGPPGVIGVIGYWPIEDDG
jgi:hypothetical protein